MKSETECWSRPPSLNSLTCSRAAWLLTGEAGAHRGHQGTSFHQPLVTYLPQGKNCKAAASPRAWKHSRDNVATLTLCPRLQQGVNVHNTFYTSHLLQEKGNSDPANPCQNRGAAMTLTRFPLPVDIPHSLGRLCLVYTKAPPAGLPKWNPPFVTVLLAWKELAECKALTVRLFCVKLDWGFRSFRGCHSSISIIFLLISCSLKHNQVYSYSWHMNSEQIV